MESRGVTGPFRPSDRLLDSRDFRRVLRGGQRRTSSAVVVYLADRSDFPRQSRHLHRPGPSGSRLGLTTSRKVGNAVVRNRFKRRVRAWFRAARAEFPRDIDLVVIARREGAQMSFAELDAALRRLLRMDPSVASPVSPVREASDA